MAMPQRVLSTTGKECYSKENDGRHAGRRRVGVAYMPGMSTVAPISMWSDGSGSVGNGPGTVPLLGSGTTDATLIDGDKKR